jgi:hypothetical protein
MLLLTYDFILMIFTNNWLDYPLVFSSISRVCIGNGGCYNLHTRMNIDDEFIPGLNQTKRIYNVKITFFLIIKKFCLKFENFG